MKKKHVKHCLSAENLRSFGYSHHDACGNGVGDFSTRIASHTTHAKVILLGEHAVVYGGPAIALPIRRLTLTATVHPSTGPNQLESVHYSGLLEKFPEWQAVPRIAINETLKAIGVSRQGLTIKIVGEIPPERGLGSSAAVAAAVSGAVAKAHGTTLTPEALFEVVQTAEREAHGNPSGIDASAVNADVPILFRAGEVEQVPFFLDSVFLVADTGVRGNSRRAITNIEKLLKSDPKRANGAFRVINTHTDAAVHDLGAGNAESLGRRMNVVRAQLRSLNVSNPMIDSLVHEARFAGAFGAKLTGSGLGGCVLALVPRKHIAAVDAALIGTGAVSTWIIDITDNPVQMRAPELIKSISARVNDKER